MFLKIAKLVHSLSGTPKEFVVLDTSLLISVIAVIVGLQLTLRLFPPIGFDRHQLSEAASTPVLVGFVAARLVFVLLDDPQTFTRLNDVLVFRSGLEFWPGALVTVLVLSWQNRRIVGGLGPFMAACVPYGLVGLAIYEAACLLRDGCLGPTANFGFTPYGLEQPMYPVGLLVAMAFCAAAWLLRRKMEWPWLPKLLISVAILGGIRTVASWFLPAIGTSRVELESTTVLVLATIGFGIVTLWLKTRTEQGLEGNGIGKGLVNDATEQKGEII